MELPILFLKRKLNNRNLTNLAGTLGKVYDDKENFICVSLELPDLDNQTGISCIPTGIYECTRDETGKHQYYKVNGVKDREIVEIHPANKPSELRGCLAFGRKWAVVNSEAYISTSRPTLDNLLKRYPKGFYLVISEELV